MSPNNFPMSSLEFPLAKLYDTMAYEIGILCVFCASWAAWTIGRAIISRRRSLSKKLLERSVAQSVSESNRSNRPKAKESAQHFQQVHSKGPAEALDGHRVAMQVIALSQDQYTKALRLYRELVKRGDDAQIMDEAFYFALVQASIRVGNADVVSEVLRAAKKHKVPLSLQFFQSVLKLLTSKHLFQECLLIHQLFQDSMPTERVLISCVALAAAECGKPEHGIQLVKSLQASAEAATGRDYLNIFRCYARTSQPEAAARLLRQLSSDRVPMEAIVSNIVLATCVGAGNVTLASQVLAEAEASNGALPLDVVSYNTVLKGLAREHRIQDCFLLLKAMSQRAVTADEITYSTLLDACVAENDFERATSVIDTFVASGCTMNTVLYTTFMKGFVRMGMLDKAMKLYAAMRRADEANLKPDVIVYSMLIKANCDQRLTEPAMRLLQDMLDDSLEPDDMLVNRLLDGCRHTSDATLAEQLFRDFIESGRVLPTPPTIATMVKIYGKCGRVEDAARIVRTMASRFQLTPSVVIYTCLMSACTRNRRLDLAFEAFNAMSTAGVQPDGKTYSTLLKGCVWEQEWDRVLDVARMTQGCRSADFPGEAIDAALAQMRAHPRAAQKAAELQSLLERRAFAPSSQARSV